MEDREVLLADLKEQAEKIRTLERKLASVEEAHLELIERRLATIEINLVRIVRGMGIGQ